MENKLKNNQLNKPNQLTRLTSEKQITLIQRKLYNCFLKTAQDIMKFERPEEQIKDGQIYKYEISCLAAHEKANVNINDYEYVKKQLVELVKIVVTIDERDNKDDWGHFSLLPKIYKIGDKYEYYLWGNIVKALREQNFFTTLDIMTVNLLTSQYSIILYELAIRFEKKKIPRMSIRELRELTGTTKEYSRFDNFKARVLDFACQDINEKTDIILSYTLEKQGRSIAFIDFFIERKKEEKKESAVIKGGVGQRDFDGNIHYANGVELKEVIELFALVRKDEQVNSLKIFLSENYEKYGFEKIQRNILYSNKKAKDNYQAFLRKAVINDYGLVLQEKKELKAKTTCESGIEVSEEEHSEIVNTNNENLKYAEKALKMLEEEKIRKEIERIEKEAKYQKAYGHLR